MIGNPMQDRYRKQHEDLRSRRDDALGKVEEIQQRARDNSRENTQTECQEIDAQFQLINDLDGQLRVTETKMRDQAHVQKLIADGLLPRDNRASQGNATGERWIDQATGRAVHMLSNKERFSDLPQANPSLAGCSIGDVIQAAVTANWSRVPSDVRQAMS